MADVIIYCLLMAHDLDIDLDSALAEKLAENEEKYPRDAVSGRSTKYTNL